MAFALFVVIVFSPVGARGLPARVPSDLFILSHLRFRGTPRCAFFFGAPGARLTRATTYLSIFTQPATDGTPPAALCLAKCFAPRDLLYPPSPSPPSRAL